MAYPKINWFIKLDRNKQADNRLEILVDAVEASVSPPIKPIITCLKKRFQAVVTSKDVDVITGAGRYELRIEDCDIVVHQSDWYDIVVYAKDPAGEELLERIAESLKQELA